MKKTLHRFWVLAAIAAVALTNGCSKDAMADGDFELSGAGAYGKMADGEAEGSVDVSETGQDNTNAGMLTAGEWNDLDNWQFWGNLMLSQGNDEASQLEDGEYYEGNGSFYQYCPYWKFYTQNRVAVNVTNGESPAAGVKVVLKVDGTPVWTAVTDNLGQANCWANLFTDGSLPETANLTVNIAGVDQPGAPVLTKWASDSTTYNTYNVSKSITDRKADIAFIVDATGSMGDEMDFLKSDLVDIFSKVAKLQSGTTIRVASVFYRDEDDDYVTKAKDFTTDIKAMSTFVGKQSASGGGDYPEAVHTALEKGLQSLSWDEGARSKIAFMLLDAPAHHNDEVIASLQSSIEAYAKAGIKIIPVAASGVDKATEFMLRFFAVSTSGTYVFLTNDSGIGGDHIQASVGDYEVELLNELIVRLIDKYLD